MVKGSVILSTLALLAPLPAVAQGSESYRVTGRCPGQPPYSGVATLSGAGPIYEWSQRINSGQTFEGVAIEQGGVLSVGFTGSFRGVLQARRTARGWDGVWTGANNRSGDFCRESWVRR